MLLFITLNLSWQNKIIMNYSKLEVTQPLILIKGLRDNNLE